jgi:hypothetical protein
VCTTDAQLKKFLMMLEIEPRASGLHMPLLSYTSSPVCNFGHCLYLFFGDAGVRIQSFTFARQAFYYLSHAPRPWSLCLKLKAFFKYQVALEVFFGFGFKGGD